MRRPATPLASRSRVITVRHSSFTQVATLAVSGNQPEGPPAASQGNAQTARPGDLFAGWDARPPFSEFSPPGQSLSNAEFPGGVTTCRVNRAMIPVRRTGQARLTAGTWPRAMR